MVAGNVSQLRQNPQNGANGVRPPLAPPLPDSDPIVIAGISGRFPESSHMSEFMDNLLNGVDMVTVNERRFKPGLYDVPRGFGTLREIDRFDADAFGMLPSQVRRTDPQLRMTLECVYEAMCDAGVNPADERGSNTGVFLGLCTSESLTLWNQELNRIDGQALIGCSSSMHANRVSYAFDFKGPSCAYDTACSTSIFALEAAVSAMRAGKCDAAIVTASTLILTPTVNVQFNKLGMLSKDSKCKSFDKSGDGFARAETVATIYLQRASVARRAYASVLHIKTNTDGYKDEGITFPSSRMQEKLLRDVYREAGIRREEVTYVEAHGTGTSVGDPQEMSAISRVFGGRRPPGAPPLLVGSVKSNMGHAEGASGLCSIAKVVVMIQTGVIPANLHYNEPPFALNAVRNGFIRVVNKNSNWRGGLIAVNSFGFGGVNTHFVLKPWKYGRRFGGSPSSAFAAVASAYHFPIPICSRDQNGNAIIRPEPLQPPKLVVFGGRNEAGVEEALRKITSSGDSNLMLLVNELNKTPNPVGTVRGFAIWQPTPNSRFANAHEETPQTLLQVQATQPNSRPLWFVFNGIGSQWPGMCRDLLRHPIFAKSISGSATVLKSHFDFDLYGLLNPEMGEVAFENPTNCFVGIAACQIGLVDILNTVGLRPAGFLGHSAGEMVCAYLDECLTAEETIICAYLRGSSLAGACDPGAMAVVSMTLSQVQKICPPGTGVYAACHNAIDSVTVSGSRPALEAFVQQLKDRKKGVKEVNSCGVAFHSPCIVKASVRFLTDLRAAWRVRADKARSSRWISSSIPEAEWDSTLAVTAGPEYFVNNFLNPVLFYEALLHIPEGATVLEIGPSGLLRGLIKKTCPTATVIPLQSRSSAQGLVDLYTALGKVYLTGINLDVNRLNGGGTTNVFPVPVGTPFLSSLITGAWDHETIWEVPYFGMNGERQMSRFEVDISSEADSFLTGHVVQGRVLFPATGYLLLVWKNFAQSHQMQYEECPVVFENIRLHRVTVLNTRSPVEFRIHISEVTGAFEVKESGAVVASGTVRAPDSNPTMIETRMDESAFEEVEAREMSRLAPATQLNLQLLRREDIYKRFRFYGFEYEGIFRGIRASDQGQGANAITWHGNWIAFLDTFLQTCIEPFDRSELVRLPTAMTKIVLNPILFLCSLSKKEASPEVFVLNNKDLGLIKCHGIEFHGPQTTTVGARGGGAGKEPRPELFSVNFTPYFDSKPENDISEACPVLQCVTIVMENLASRFTSTPSQPSALDPVTVVELDSTDGGASELGMPGDDAAAERLEVERLIRHSFGVLDLNYTIFTTQHKSDEFRSRFASASSGIQLKGFDAFQKESWLDKCHDLIILHNHRLLLFACQYMRKGSFMLLRMAHASALATAEVEDKIGPKLSLVACKYGAGHVVYLIRKNTKQEVPPDVIEVSSQETDWVPTLQEAVRRQEELQSATGVPSRPPRVYLVSKKLDSGIRGLINCLRKEAFTQQFRMILDMRVHPEDCDSPDFANPSPELALILKHDLAINVFNSDGRWGFYSACDRLEYKNAIRSTGSAFVGMTNIGDLSTFRWIEGWDFKALALTEHSKNTQFVPVDVHYAALNFKDIMLATGNLPPPDVSPASPFALESPLGLEFAGTTTRGSPTPVRVCGYVEGQAMATQVLAYEPQLWRIPEAWSFAEAATVPVVYATAFMALVLRGNLQPGESVLIHSGAGGVGQAAIRIALARKCVVFTTVGAADKQAFIREQFPSIDGTHIGNSRDTSFENMVLGHTKGRGVDVVLNSLSGDKLDASVRCLARHGRFLEIGKFDLVANKALGMALFLKDASFHGVMLDSLWDAPEASRLQLHELLQEGIDSGVVHPLPYRVFQREQVEPAFRYMGPGKHVGKILIQVRKEGDTIPLKIVAHPRVYFNPSTSYIVVGGLGGIGLEFVNWMIGRGARRIVIASRSGVTTPYQAGYLEAWKQRDLGVDAQIVPYDASRMGDARALVAHAVSMGPLDGFFNLALSLELAFMKDQTEESFRAAMEPKVLLTRNMDHLTRELCPALSHFVVFSSIVAGIGLPGQCAYGLANAGCESICEQRARDGLAGRAIELGPISDVGVFHRQHSQNSQNLSSYAGVGTQSVGSVLRCLDVLMTAPRTPVVVSRVHRPLTGASGGSSAGASFLSITDRIGHILGTDISRLNPRTKLTELGLDSIMSMELKQVLEQDYALSLSATEIRTVTLEQLLEMSKNSEKNKLGVGGKGGAGLLKERRAATADLFQFDFMRNAKKTKILYPQCVHPLNKVERSSSTSGPEAGTVFVCNSIEGPEILRILGGLIRRSAYSMQFPQDAPLHDLHAMADYYLRELKATEPQGPYVIAGYSAGTFMAIELALRLQELGEITKLVFIDLTPGRADAILEENFGPDRARFDETTLMIVTLSQVLNIDRAHLEAMLTSLPDRESRVQKAVELGTAFFDDKVDAKIFERLLGDSQIQIINLFNGYKPEKRFDGKVVLVRTTQNLISYDSTEYWGLEEFCSCTPIVRTVESTHSYIVAEPGVYQVAAAINND